MADQVPLLLVDVDGVVSLFGFDHTSPPPVFPVTVDGIPHWLSKGAGARLIGLARTYQCVWCTGWEERAEEHLPHFLGLPGGWEHIAFDLPRSEITIHWKVAAIDAFAGPDRPLAWVDDDHDERCLAWARARPGPTLLVTTLPAVGLTDDHVAALEGWANDGFGGRDRAGMGSSRAMSELRPVALGPGEGTTIEGPAGGPLTFKVRGEQTGGSLTAFENVIAPGDGPPLHTHADEDEAWYVIHGTLRFRLGDTNADAPAGTFVFVPRGTPHAFANAGSEPARILVLFTPSGMERFFDRFAQLEAFDPGAFAAIGADVGMDVTGPPLRDKP